MKKRILIHDIAKHLDVSIATVSLVLNGRAKEKRISDVLAERVLNYVNEVGYKPNQLAKSLRSGKTHVLGLVVEDIANPFFATVARLIERKALENGYHIIYCSTNRDTAMTKDILTMFEERHVDGYVLALPEGLESEVSALVRSGKPLVMFDRVLSGVPANAVVVDGATGMYEAAQHLLVQGYKSIALITIMHGQTQMITRRQGYTQALREHNLPELVSEVELNQEPAQIVGQMESFFQAHPHCEAVLFTTNYLGLYGLEALNRLGWSVPDRIAVISFDDNALFRLYSPPITVVAQPLEVMAEEIIKVLLTALKGAKPTNGMVLLQLTPKLLIRQSSIRPSESTRAKLK